MAWFIGDEFMDRSFTENFKHMKTNGTSRSALYTLEHFEILNFTTNKYKSSIQPVLPRIIALLSHAIQKEKYLPKVLIFVLDADIMKQINFPTPCRFNELKFLLNYLIEEVHRVISNYKEYLPIKAKHPFFPHIIWVLPPTH